MSQFFSQPEPFVKALGVRPDRKSSCWACCAPAKYLAPFNVVKDLRLLDLAAPDGVWAIRLCPTCAVKYMLSFNDRLQAHGGDEADRYRCKAPAGAVATSRTAAAAAPQPRRPRRSRQQDTRPAQESGQPLPEPRPATCARTPAASE